MFEAFSDLQQIDESRLEFFVPSDPTGPARHEIGHYARITGPAWAGLSASVVRIGIKDAPGEKERREFERRPRHDRLTNRRLTPSPRFPVDEQAVAVTAYRGGVSLA